MEGSGEGEGEGPWGEREPLAEEEEEEEEGADDWLWRSGEGSLASSLTGESRPLASLSALLTLGVGLRGEGGMDSVIDLSKTLQKPYQAKALFKRSRMTLVSAS